MQGCSLLHVQQKEDLSPLELSPQNHLSHFTSGSQDHQEKRILQWEQISVYLSKCGWTRALSSWRTCCKASISSPSEATNISKHALIHSVLFTGEKKPIRSSARPIHELWQPPLLDTTFLSEESTGSYKTKQKGSQVLNSLEHHILTGQASFLPHLLQNWASTPHQEAQVLTDLYRRVIQHYPYTSSKQAVNIPRGRGNLKEIQTCL